MRKPHRAALSRVSTVLAGVLLLASCGLGSIDDDDDPILGDVRPAAAVAPIVAVWGAQIVAGLVDEGISEASDAAVGWAFSQLGMAEPTDDVTVKLEELDKKIGQLQAQLDALDAKITAMFEQLECNADRRQLTQSVSVVLDSRDEYLRKSVKNVPQAERVAWAYDVLDKGNVRLALTTIHNRLVNADGGANSLLGFCARDTVNKWEPANQIDGVAGKFANDRFYYNSIYAIYEFYFDVQAMAAYLLVTADNLVATEKYNEDPQSGPLSSQTMAAQVCPQQQVDLSSRPAVGAAPVTRQGACLDARQTMVELEARLRQQLTLAGVSYSYAVIPNPDVQAQAQTPYVPLPGAEQVSSVKSLNGAGAPRLWVKDPTQYPNLGKTAAEARRIEDTGFAGLSGWRGSNSTEWTQLLDSLGNRFSEEGREGYLDRTLTSVVGFTFIAGMPNDGRGAVIWMDTQTANFGGNAPWNEAFCILIPYSQRNNNETGGGRPLCDGNDLKAVLLNVGDFPKRSNQWLDAATRGTYFRFGPAQWSEPDGGAAVPEGGFFDRAGYLTPDWVKQAKQDHAGWDGPVVTDVVRTIDNRSEQTMFPVVDVGPERCTEGRSPTTSEGVPTMCGDNLNAFLDAVITPIPKS